MDPLLAYRQRLARPYAELINGNELRIAMARVSNQRPIDRIYDDLRLQVLAMHVSPKAPPSVHHEFLLAAEVTLASVFFYDLAASVMRFCGSASEVALREAVLDRLGLPFTLEAKNGPIVVTERPSHDAFVDLLRRGSKNALGHQIGPNFRDLVNWAQKVQMLPDSDIEDWKDAPDARNDTAHGDDSQFMTSQATVWLRGTIQLVNRLYPDPATAAREEELDAALAAREGGDETLMTAYYAKAEREARELAAPRP